ncbi:MAG: tyrosine-type recombinase/integrase [Lachnospiraceae bacterium]|nr:tyrosine-type recombinase/integrase [Lachnospiraceae bacterium]
MEHRISISSIEDFRVKLIEEERSLATIDKYMRDIRFFFQWLGKENVVEKEKVIAYKNELVQKYAMASVNSILAALNSFFKGMGWYDCVVRSVKVQREAFRTKEQELTKAEYYRLLNAAREKGNTRLYHIMQTICSTGIRVSELQFITVESLQTKRATVHLKGKTRTILLTPQLCRELNRYVKENHLKTGSIFITRNGKPVDRTNILHDMKALCEKAQVSRQKVFPHNLRHLFACTYYQLEKDITHLADLLGHSNINTTRIYTLVSCEEQEKQIEMLGLVL